MDNPFYIIPTLSRTAHITNLYVQKEKKIYKSKIPVKLLTKKRISSKKLMLSIFWDILLSHYLYVFFISSATDSTFVPTITCTLVLLNFITPFAPARFNAASFT